ncbi:unnamed protein product [Urochloa decumbens]|uniref:AAA+ ATPase domain-containing protein n=1 Tax=Urochloa decumbens TaxID=240449 RepID=A0ABC9AU69_9POAL
MDLVTGALGKLPSKLLVLLRDEYKLQTGVKDQIRRLTRELESIHATLRKVAQAPPDQLDEQVRLWASDIREASYDMEDIIDTFLIRVDGPPKEPADEAMFKSLMKKMGKLFSLSKSKACHKIAGAIDVLSKQLEEVEKLRGRYTIDDIVHKPAAMTSIDPRLSALYPKASQLVGIDEQRDKLIQMLTEGDHDMQPNQETKIVSVVGVGGLGKTTLVKAVYDKLNLNAPCKAFVPVGQNPDLKKVLKDILIALDKESYMKGFDFNILDERQLIDELREFLKDKRYFIVIDDVWDIESWKIIRNALDDNSLGSKIVITTRKHDVADEAGCSYKLKPLTHKISKILFYGRIFGSESECPAHFSEVSEKILKKCGGVPLAIVTTSSLLANKSGNIKVWNEVCDSIGSGLGSNHNMEIMRKILSLSYYDLPSHLKTCLLYISIFPEDYEIEKKRLIWRWIAEDFVQHGEVTQSLYELGESYFNELLNRSLIQVADMLVDGTPRSCRVHDMVLELICSLSRQENFVTTVLGDSRQRTPPSGSKKVRRLSLQNTAWPTMEISKLRSIAIFSSAIFSSMTSLSCCHLLRVLDLQGCNLKNLPSLRFVGKLFHLRYLSLAYTDYGGELPAEIGKLQFLQTLDLFWIKIDERPLSIIIAGLRQMICLRVALTRLPNGLRCLTSLEHLREVIVDSACMAEELGHLTQLRMLYVQLRKDKDGRWDESLCTGFLRSLAKLHKIQKLLVVTSSDVAADLEGSVESLGNLSYLHINKTTSLPTWISPASLLLLSYLRITMVQVRTADIRVLGMLQALRYLHVEVSGDIQVLERFIVSHDAFPCAIKCSFFGFSMTPSAFQPGAMPRLEEFKFSIRLKDFTAGKFIGDDLALGHLPSLQSMRVDLLGEQDVSEEVVVEVEEKLKHKADVHRNHPYIEFRK